MLYLFNKWKQKTFTKKEELNFVVSDIYNNPKAVKLNFTRLLLLI